MATLNAEVVKELSPSQVISDHLLAWQLQAEEYKKGCQLNYQDLLPNYSTPKGKAPTRYQFQNLQGNSISFTLKPTPGDGDCFFHAVNKPGFNRNTLITKLLENATDNAVLSIFVHEIRQFLYLGYTGNHPDKQENEACQQLLTENIRGLFFALKGAEEILTLKVSEARFELGEAETQGKLPEELLALLRQRNSSLVAGFEQAYQSILNANEAIYQYCCQDSIFKNYVGLYLRDARGYIPFSRDFGAEVPKTTIDVINQLFQLKIQVYLPHKTNKTQLQLANQPQSGETVPIFHNGVNHFWGLNVFATPLQSFQNHKEENHFSSEQKKSVLTSESTTSQLDTTLVFSNALTQPRTSQLDVAQATEPLPSQKTTIGAVSTEMMEEFERILSIMRSLNISKGNTQTKTVSESESSVLNLALPPIQSIDGNSECSLEVFKDYRQGESKFRRLLERNGLFATEVSDSELNCFICSLLQHAKKQYNTLQFEPDLIKQIKIKAGLSQKTLTWHDDIPEALTVLKAVNEICNVNLIVHFIRINQEGQPMVFPPLIDEALQNPRQPVLIWQQPGHCVAIVSRKLVSLCKLGELEGKINNQTAVNVLLQNQIGTKPSNLSINEFLTLPKIPYDRKELQKIIDELSLPSEITVKVIAYVNNIEHQISEIQKYQSKINFENFYEAIRTAILEIQNVADSIYELVKVSHQKLSFTLKQRILEWITPLKNELIKHSVMSAAERSTLELKTKHLYAEQSLVSRDPLIREVFMQYLKRLKEILLDSNKPLPCCYIGYAWPSQENYEQEYWIQPFLYLLYDHLTAVGIRVIMDIRDNKPEDSIYPFIKQYQEGNYVILVGTESLLQKHYSHVPNIMQTQLNTLFQKIEQDQKQFGESRLYPMLISGALKTSYPEYYHQYSTVKDAREVGYLNALKEIIDWIYQSRLEVVRYPYLELWQAFTTTYPNLPQTSNAIGEELAFEYHQRYVDYLKQSIQYQSIAVQESTQYTQATEAEMIDTLRHSQGTNPKTLFDGNGQQFQRPNLNIDFIERADFDMMNSFTKQFQLCLILQGAPGVGKTELAKFYFLHPSKPYTLRAWFDASSIEALSQQYIELAVSNRLRFDMPTPENLKHVKQWLEQQDCLLVYDNVLDMQTIEELIPKQGKHHILITARIPLDTQSYQALSIGALKEQEAVAFICRITGYLPEQFFLKELVHKLELLPSSLVQAGNYMRAKSINSYQYWLRYQRYKEYLRTNPIKQPEISPKKQPIILVAEPLESVKEMSSPECLSPLFYDRKALEEMVTGLSLTQRVAERVTACFNQIETRISDIHRYQLKKNLENFYKPILATFQEIRNIAHELYKLIEFYHPNFPELVRTRIIEGIVPLETELQKCLEDNQRKQNVFLSKRLCAEQSFIFRQPALMQHLEKLKVFLAEQDKPIPRCYICYAWPSSNPEEYWVQPFLNILYDHLKAIGIEVRMDIRDIKLGESVYQFMKQYQSEDYLILIGTESLLQKHYSIMPHAMQTALNIALSRGGVNQMQSGESRIYPLLISGTIKTAYPEHYHLYSRVQDAREAGYLGALKGLIEWMYGQYLPLIQPQMNACWRTFYDACPSLPQEPSAVEAEITLGYHQQCLEALKQDGCYQRVEAQEKTPHSLAVQAEMINTWMKSKGYNPQSLLEENGQQFQRPYSNPNFVERPKLWEKMTQHFATAEHQILTLTAHGLGGMGKTELAGRYYLHPPKAYDLRAWFDASSKENLFLQYIDLASSNGMKFASYMPIEEKVARVKRWLEEKKDCLLIYDNVPNADTITQWLPRKGKHHILITSRNAVDWHAHQKLDVDIMEEEEAIALICKVTGYKSDEPQLKELIHALGLLPLALAQAAAYMKVKNKPISDYLSEYQQSQDSLITPDINPKHEPVWVTFNMNFKSLQQECPAALMTLKQASWLSHRAIPETLLLIMTEEVGTKPKELLWDDIKENMLRYSLMQVDVERLQLSMHPLLQAILREQQKVSWEWYSVLLQGISTEFRRKTNALEKQERERILLPHIQTALSFSEKLWLHSTLTLEFSQLLRDIGYFFLYSRREPDIAISYYERALKIEENHYGKDHVEIARILMHICNANANKRAKNQIELLNRALKIFQNHYGKEDVQVALVLTNMGYLYNNLGFNKEAKEFLERALRINEHYYGKDDVEVGVTLANLGVAYGELGNAEKKKELLERALTIDENHYGKNHVEVAITLLSLANAYGELGNIEKKKELLERALTIDENHYGKDHVEVAIILTNLGSAYNDLGNSEKAKDLLERALRIEEQYCEKGDITIATTLTYLGSNCLILKDVKNAKELFGRAIKIKENYYGNDHPQVAKILEQLALVNFDLGEADQSQNLSRRVYDIYLKFYGSENGNTKRAFQQLQKLKNISPKNLFFLNLKKPPVLKEHILSVKADDKRAILNCNTCKKSNTI